MTMWNRSDAIREVADKLWLYLSASAQRNDVAAVIEHLWELPPGDLKRVAAAHIALQPETLTMLEACKTVLRELPSSVAASPVELVGVVRGPIDWTRTRARQWQTGDRTRFICSPPERRYDTPLARLVLLALTRCVNLIDAAALDGNGDLSVELRRRRRDVIKTRGSKKLDEVTLVRTVPEPVLRSLTRFRGVEPIIDFLRTVREAVDELDPGRLKHVLGSLALVPTTDDKLFELMVGFSILDHARAAGRRVMLRVLPGRRGVFAVLEGDPTLRLYWQKSVAVVMGGGRGRYQEIRVKAGLTGRSPLRPDFLLVSGDLERILLVEVKHTGREDKGAVHAGVTDALAYLYDLDTSLSRFPSPRALVVAWGTSAKPNAESDVVITGYETIAPAVASIAEAWRRHQVPADS